MARPRKTSANGNGYQPRLKERYEQELRPQLKGQLQVSSVMDVPRLQKITLNMGIGDAKTEAKVLENALDQLTTIAGQRAQVRRARKSIASFKLREGMPVGVRVTLRGARMWEFLDRLISIALPRIRDFRGLSTRSFDGRGNYTVGLKDQLVFMETNYAKVDKVRGMNVTLVTTARTDEEAKNLLTLLGMPFRRD